MLVLCRDRVAQGGLMLVRLSPEEEAQYMAELRAAADAQRPTVEAAEAKRNRKALKRQRDADRQRGILGCPRNTCL